MEVYLCLHGLCCRLAPAWNGRHLSLIKYLCELTLRLVNGRRHYNLDAVTRGVGLTNLRKFFASGRPLAFQKLLSCLNERKLEPISQKVGSQNSETILDWTRELLSNARGLEYDIQICYSSQITEFQQQGHRKGCTGMDFIERDPNRFIKFEFM
jgi:hypothetical protein